MQQMTDVLGILIYYFGVLYPSAAAADMAEGDLGENCICLGIVVHGLAQGFPQLSIVFVFHWLA